MISNQQSNVFVTVYEKANEVFDFSDSKFFNHIESIVFDDLFHGKYDSKNAKVRKSAHFGIYFILGILSATFAWIVTEKWVMVVLLGLTLPTTIAVLDEFNQSFIDRTSSLSDVLLDSSGALMGMIVTLIAIIILKIINQRVTKQQNKLAVKF